MILWLLLACKLDNSDDLAIPLMSYSKTVNLDGAVITYSLKGFPNKDMIEIKGVLKIPVHIYVSCFFWSYTQMRMYVRSSVGPPCSMRGVCSAMRVVYAVRCASCVQCDARRVCSASNLYAMLTCLYFFLYLVIKLSLPSGFTRGPLEVHAHGNRKDHGNSRSEMGWR